MLIIVAASEALGTLTSLPGIVIFFTDDFPTALLRFAQGLLSVKLALAPFVAMPAFMFALKSRLREATLALADGWLALKDRRPWLAALLVCVPTIFYWVGVAIFAVTMMIYGF